MFKIRKNAKNLKKKFKVEKKCLNKKCKKHVKNLKFGKSFFVNLGYISRIPIAYPYQYPYTGYGNIAYPYFSKHLKHT